MDDQSNDRMSEAISPGAFKKSIDDDLEITIFSQKIFPTPNAARCHQRVCTQRRSRRATTHRSAQANVRPRSTQARAPKVVMGSRAHARGAVRFRTNKRGSLPDSAR